MRLKRICLLEIQKLLVSNGKSLNDFETMSIPQHSEFNEFGNILLFNELNYDVGEMDELFNQHVVMLNEDKKMCMIRLLKHVWVALVDFSLFMVMAVLIRCFYGKPYRISSIHKGSGIASLLLPGGKTAHSQFAQFAIPLNLSEDSCCSIKQGTLDRTLKDLMCFTIKNSNEKRQIFPIVPNASRAEIVRATINSSTLWQYCKVLRLTKNISSMLNSDTIQFAKWILDLGDGKLGSYNEVFNIIYFQRIHTTSAMDTSCQQKGFFTFLPQNITKAPHYCCPVIDNLRSEAKHMGNILNEGEHEHPLIKSKLPPQPHGSNNHSLFQRSCSESKKLWHIAAPSIFTRLAMFSITVVTQSLAGHLGDLDLAAISIACTVLISITFGFLLGMASALETLCGQAYGAGQQRILGVYLQRSWVVLFLSSILLLPVFIFATPVLKLIGQPVAVAEQAGLVAVWLIPLHLSFPFQFTLQRFLQCQLKTGIIAWVSGVALAVHVLVSWVFVYRMRIGIVGTALSIGFSWWLSVLGMLGYTLFGGCPRSWTGFSVEAFVGLWEFFKLSLASGVMLALENFYYRLLLIVSGYMHNTEIAIDALSCDYLWLGVHDTTSIFGRNRLGGVVRLRILWCTTQMESMFRTAVNHKKMQLEIISGIVFLPLNFMQDLSYLMINSACCKPVIKSPKSKNYSKTFSQVRVANELGAGNAKGARFATVVSVVTTLFVGFIFWLVIVSFNKNLALIFTSSSSVIQMVNELAMLLAFTVLLNCIQPVLSGVAVGSGRQAVVAYINIGSYYLIGIPLGVLLGWLLPSGIGMWTGMMSGTVVQTLILAIITMRYDWEKEVQKAQILVEEEATFNDQ
ncbi:Protein DETOXIFICATION 27 [Glycine max]|nr:Protein DETOXIFICATION 27 [Glycine max]